MGKVADGMSATGNSSSSRGTDLEMSDLLRDGAGQPGAGVTCSSPGADGQTGDGTTSILVRERVEEALREEAGVSSALQPNKTEEEPSVPARNNTAMSNIISAASSYTSYPTISESSSWKALDATPEDLVSSSSNSSWSGESSPSSGIHPHSILHVSMPPLEHAVSGLTTLATATATTFNRSSLDYENDSTSSNGGFYAKLKAAANAFLPPSTAASSNSNEEWPRRDGQNLQQLEDRVLSKRDIAGRLVLPQERYKSDGVNNDSSKAKQDSATHSRNGCGSSSSIDSHPSHTSSSHRYLPTTSSPLSLPVVQEQSILEEWNTLHNTHRRHSSHTSAVSAPRPGAYHQAPGQIAVRRARCRSLYPNQNSIDSAFVSQEDGTTRKARNDNSDDTSNVMSLPSLARERHSNTGSDHTNDSSSIVASFSYNDDLVTTDELSSAFSVSSFSLQGYQEQQDHLPPDVVRMMDADIPPVPGTPGSRRYTDEEAGTERNGNRRNGQDDDNYVQDLYDEESIGSFSVALAGNQSNVGNADAASNRRDPGIPTTTLATSDGLVEARPVQVQDTSNIISADPVDEDGQHSTFAKHLCFKGPVMGAILTCMLLFMGLIVAIAVIYATGSTSDTSIIYNDDSFSSQRNPSTTERGLLIQQKLEKSLGNATFSVENDSSLLLVALSNPKINATKNNGDMSACRKALDWLVNSDELYLNHTSENLLQRFLLAYFYHHTSEETRWISCNPAQGQESNFCSYHYVGPLGEHYDESPFHIRWLSPEDECDWAGVYCNDLNQVNEINLNGYSLSGTFPAKIAMLHNLTSLSLRDSQFMGQLPSELSTLSNLKVLRLNRNGFIGSVPQQWEALTSLVHLDIAWNQLTGTLKLDSLSNLENLWIDHNQFSGSVSVSSLTKLRQLFLSHCDFVGSIPDLDQLTDLQYLDISANPRISGTLPTEIGMLSQLLDLVLSSTSFHGTLPMELYSLSQLQDLKLDNCNFTGTLSPQIAHMAGLQNLVLAGNNFVGTLPEGLGQLKALIHAQLQDTGFVGTVPESMCLLKGPNTLKDLVADCAAPVPSAIEETTDGAARPPVECPDGCCTSCCDAETKICLAS